MPRSVRHLPQPAPSIHLCQALDNSTRPQPVIHELGELLVWFRPAECLSRAPERPGQGNTGTSSLTAELQPVGATWRPVGLDHAVGGCRRRGRRHGRPHYEWQLPDRGVDRTPHGRASPADKHADKQQGPTRRSRSERHLVGAIGPSHSVLAVARSCSTAHPGAPSKSVQDGEQTAMCCQARSGLPRARNGTSSAAFRRRRPTALSAAERRPAIDAEFVLDVGEPGHPG